jgi:competence protein ComEC
MAAELLSRASVAKLGRTMQRLYEDGYWRLETAIRCLSCLLVCLLVCAVAATAVPPKEPNKPLRVYFVDVEGGQATLFVTPEGNSLLIDTGWPGNHGRDADRIVAAAHDAGIQKIDYVLITHYHDDHVGGAPQLAAKIPIGTFIDHGENREPGAQKLYDAYKALLDSGKYKHIVARPGDKLPIKGIDVAVITADGAVLEKPLPGAGQTNPACKATGYSGDQTENPRSLDLGDLTADKERELMCPINRLGKIDVYIASHHGFLQSGSMPLVHAIAPRLSIVDNGATKGGSPSALQLMKTSPEPKDIWQLHYSEEATVNNTVPEFIANLQGPDASNYLKLMAQQDGSFSVFNSRTKETKIYSSAR